MILVLAMEIKSRIMANKQNDSSGGKHRSQNWEDANEYDVEKTFQEDER